MFHAQCTRCCAAGLCHFCVSAPGKHAVAGKGGCEYLVCTAHLAWLANGEYAPAVDALPVEEIPDALLGRQPDGGTGKRMIELLNRREGLEVPALLR